MIQLHIEPTGFCNAACDFCIYPSDENKKLPKSAMDLSLYTRIIDEARTIPQIEQIAFAGLCEPLIDTCLETRIRYARVIRPDWRIELYTNGTLLSPIRFDSLKGSGLDVLVISLNAVNQTQHREIMGLKDKFQIVCDNTNYAIDNRGAMHVEVRAVLSPKFKLADAQAFTSRWGMVEAGGNGKLIGEMNWADQLGRTTNPFDPNSWCNRATGQIAVHRDGRVNLCCLDALSKHSWGDLKFQTIREVYNSPEYAEFRRIHSENQASLHPVCAVCTRV